MSHEAAPSIEDLLGQAAWTHRLATRLVGDSDDADELVQLTRIELLRHPHVDIRSPRAFLGTLLRGLARDLRRSASRRSVRERTAARPEASGALADHENQAALQRELTDAVLKLDDVLRSTIWDVYFNGLTLTQIAAREGVSLSAAKSRHVRAIRNLRLCFDRKHGGDRRAWATTLLPLAYGGSYAHPASSTVTAPKAIVAASVAVVLVGGLFLAARWLATATDLTPAVTALANTDGARDVADSSLRQHEAAVPTSHREPIARHDQPQQSIGTAVPPSASRLQPVVTIGEGLFDPDSDGPRAIAVDKNGLLFAFEYGRNGRCLIFDLSGHLVGESRSIGFGSEAVRLDDRLFLTKPGVPQEAGGRLCKFNTATLSAVAEVVIDDPSGKWLCDALCVFGNTLFVGVGGDGGIYRFNTDLQPLGKWYAIKNLHRMEASRSGLIVATSDPDVVTVQALDFVTRAVASEQLRLNGYLVDLCSVADDTVLLLLEDGRLLQYALSTDNEPASWTLQAQTNLAVEPWFIPSVGISRTVYDEQFETLFVSFGCPQPRVVGVPYSVQQGCRKTVIR